MAVIRPDALIVTAAQVYVPACGWASASCAVEPRISAAAMTRRMRQNFIGSSIEPYQRIPVANYTDMPNMSIIK
jgi:hypothetical protein